MHKSILSLLLLLLVGATLIQSKIFLSPSAFSYYGYNVLGGILLSVAAWEIFKIKDKIEIKNIIPISFFVIYTFYNGLNSAGQFSFAHIALFAHLCLFLGYLLLFSSNRLDFLSVVRVFSIIALLESSLCIAQFFDLFSLQGKLFKVHGSLSNPNYIAIFLTLLFPALYYSYKEEKGFWRAIARINILFVIVSLLLLQCRTAFIGTFVAILYLQGVQNNWKEIIVTKIKQFSKIQQALLIIALLSLISISFIGLYHFKKDSTEGRLFIWKLALQLGIEKPITGQGLATFEQKYNLKQAAYFQKENSSEQEIFTAAHVNTPYNEYLLIFIEGGIIALLIFVAFLLALLIPTISKGEKKREHQTVLAAVLSFSIMAMSNFIFTITSVMAVFMIYAAFLSTFETNFSKSVILFRKQIVFLSIALCLFGFLLTLYQTQIALASMKVKRASQLIKKGKI